MAPAAEADITPFGMSCAGGAPPLVFQLGWGCAWTISSTSSEVTPSRASLREEPSPQPMLVAFRRQVLRTAGSPHPCGIYGWARPATRLDSAALSRRYLIRPSWPGAATRDENRVARPSSALVRQSPLIHGRFSFQHGVNSQSRQPESFTESEAPPWWTSGAEPRKSLHPARWPLSPGPTTIPLSAPPGR
jgi:hypothetical protein